MDLRQGSCFFFFSSRRRHTRYWRDWSSVVCSSDLAFLERFHGRVVNPHPALSPSFPGIHAPEEALAYGVKVTGCTLFIVDDGVDSGPVVAQAAVPVEEDDDAESLHERIKAAERPMLVEAVGRMTREGWSVRDRRVRFGNE